MKYRLIVLLLGLSCGTAWALAAAADITGTWAFSVDTGGPKPFSHTFVFKQEGEKLTGTHTGPIAGEHEVTGTVKGNKAAFSYTVTSNKGTLIATFTGTIASSTKMTGTVEYSTAPPAKWTATKTTKK
jgi:hypothetical protein